MEMYYLLSSLLLFLCFQASFEVSLPPRAPDLQLLLAEGVNVTFPDEQHRQLEFADYPQADGLVRRTRPADDPLPLPLIQSLSYLDLNLERSHHELYEALWRNADVPMDTSSATKIEVLGYLLKKQIEKLRRVSNGQVELVFLVDSSASVGIENFFNELKFVKKLLADFTVAPDATRVAIITFSSKHRVELNVNQLDNSIPGKHHHKCALLNEDLPKITYVGGGTYTKGAFELAKKVLQGARANSTQAVFLLTDGLSNGPNPVPVAVSLKEDGVEVFSFGIRDGYIPELLQMASEKKDEHCYILDSFAEFEALARRALHEDLRMGEFIEETPEKCSSRCLGENRCCDMMASCRCGTHTGSYDCVCPAGFYGSGLRGKCTPCPIGSYKRDALPGGINTCLPCPDQNHVSPLNNTSPYMCVCKDGYRWDIATHRCKVIHCPLLQRPEYGEFVECSNVVNGACAVRCNRGYEITGSSIRLCFSNGTWSGEDFDCRVKTCEVLTAPMNGSLECTSNDYAFGTECASSCDSGFKLIGSHSRRCLPIAHWDGIPVHCRPIQCPMLPPIPYGYMTPPHCNTQKQDYGNVCKISCRQGFYRNGPRKKECLANGSWNTKLDASQTCIDFMPPVLECPTPIRSVTSSHTDRVVLEWAVPTPTDNSGEAPILRAVPNVYPPWTFPLGHWNITYSATDQSGNVAQCVFTVLVEDREPPSIRRCRSPGTIITSKQEYRVTWDEPLFTDNSGGDVTVTRSHDPGSSFPLGTTSVEYLATDAAGNTRSCIIYVDVQQNLCQKPRDPVGGSAICFHTTQGMNCSVTCGPGYAMSTRPRKQYFCALNGTWYPDGKVPWDDCSETHHANNVLQPMTFLYETSDCDSAFARNIERILAANLEEPIREYCGENVQCELSSVKANCEDKDPIPFLRGASSSLQQTGDRSGTRLALQGPGEVSVSADRLNILQSPNLFVNIVVNASASPNDTAAFTGPTKQTYKMVVEVAASVPKQIQNNLDNGTIVTATNRTTERTFQVDRITVYREDIQPVCSSGSVRRGEGEGAKCVQCIPGTYYDIATSSCEYCEVGTFQDQMGQLSCSYCPNGTSTVGTKSTSVNDCKEYCDPGSKSSTGLELCELCPLNTYQPNRGSTHCLDCPRRRYTGSHGAREFSHCKSYCPRGKTSANGLTPCLPCPPGTFKMSQRSSYCLLCPEDYPLSNPGSITITYCRNSGGERAPTNRMMSLRSLPFSECFSSPCRNGGTCESMPGGFTCTCPPGYTGRRCGSDINECETAVCMNNGSCRDLINGYMCHCPRGFTGRHCSEDVDECNTTPPPCLNGATCIDGPQYYECVCPDGYTGTNCEDDVDDCAIDPCYNHGVCTDFIGGFQCTCPHGYHGNVCEMEINECLSYPCDNNATCKDLVNEFRCECLDGFSGTLCEVNIDECSSTPCLNGATCVDLIADIKCVCMPGFSGVFCQEEMTWDFNMVFDRGGIDDFVVLDRDFPTLSAMTISFWMVTDNTENYGTVFSYAVSDTSANVLTITDYTGFVLNVNEETIVSDITANDGRWHHIVATWDSHEGTYTMFKDGVLQANGTGLSNGTEIPGGGSLILGQDQDSLGGGFTHQESFVGEVTHLTLWARALGEAEIYALGRTCRKPSDVIIAWPDFLSGIEGQIDLLNNTFCQGCPHPMSPEGGFVKGYQPLQPLTSVTYHCNPGFELPRHEVTHAECQISGEWHPGERAYCDRINCGYPGHLKHGFVLGRMYLFGDQVFYTCVENFTLVGPLTRECLENGRWSGYTPECRYVFCREPPHVSNAIAYSSGGERQIHMAFPRHNATYQCARGYRLIGSPNITCQNDGEWTAPPTCRIVTCPSPPPSPNSMLITTNGTVFSSIAEYRCMTGYRMTGVNVLQCQENGKWDNGVPLCTILSCGLPPVVPLATFTQDGVTYGSRVQYTCNEGYEADQTVSYCGASGLWEPSPLECQRIQCPMPSAVADGSMRGGDFGFNSSVRYDCDRGYTISGNTEISCLSNGQWSSNPPACSPVSCDEPPRVDNHRIAIKQSGEYTFGMTVGYNCPLGYLFDSDITELTCGAEGHWVGKLSECTAVSCGRPTSIQNGVILGHDYTYNQTVDYSCKIGFISSGESVSRCLASGQWTEHSAQCNMVECGEPPSIPHATVSHERRFNETVTYTCQSGYVLLDAATHLRCSAEGQWEGDPPNCEPITCGAPLVPDHGFIIGTNQSFQAVVALDCDVGYILHGEASIRCQSSGQWSNTSAKCIQIVCPEPPAIPHSSIQVDSLVYGSSVTYDCHDGYILEGLPSLNCTGLGEWSDEPPSCKLVECGIPPLVENAYYLGNNLTFSSILIYFCAAGYSFRDDVASVDTICQADGTWSEEEMQCEAVNCGIPDSPSQSVIFGSNFTYPNSVMFICNPGYVINGSGSATCTSNGTWSQTESTCEPVDCGIPEDIANATFTLNTTTYGSTVDFRCVVGHMAASELMATCDETGTWTGNVTHTSCQPVPCPESPQVIGGYIEGEGLFVYGDSVKVQCHEGFKYQTYTEMRCSENGTWNPANTTCVPITCSHVLPPDNGFIAAESYLYGEIMVFDCNEGFYVQGNDTILCEGDGEWNSDIPQCLPVLCKDLSSPQNGSVQTEGVSYRSQAVYTCDNGFEMLGMGVTECTSQGVWSHPPPACSRVDCPMPINPAHGIAVFIDNRYLDDVAFECEPGYRLVGLAKQQCQADGSWSGDMPTCRPVECRVEEAFPLGIVIRNRTVVNGDKVLYSCNPGYEIAGQSFRVCGIDGFLSGQQPTCVRVTCGPPPDLLNGNVSLFNDKYESNATYSCSPGYTLDGPSSIWCLSNGSWSYTHQVCRAIQCPRPQVISNGTLLMSAQIPTYRSTVTYTCDEGYIVKGDSVLTCNEDGSWSNTIPSCEPVSCGQPPPLDKGIVTFKITTFNSQATYRCGTGYVLTGERLRTCLGNGSWNLINQVCKPISCGPLSLPLNAEVITTNTTLYGVASYTCRNGYVLSGSRTRSCSASGEWTRSSPECQPISCSQPDDIEHGIVMNLGNMQLFDEIQYHCNNGYKMLGGDRRTCQADQTWSGSVPDCRPISCDTPPIIPNGVRSYKATTFNNTALYDCHTGYSLHGVQVLRCTSDGRWLPEAPECRPIKCGPLTNPQHGKVILESKVYQSQAHYVCHDGYSISGSRSRTCLANGTWSDIQPQCSPKPCPTLPHIAHAVYPAEKIRFVVGDFVQLECENGFQPSSEGMAECLPDQSWSLAEFFCNPVECPIPEQLENGRVNYRDLVFGSVVTYTCSTGYTLVGQATSSCNLNRRWSSPPPLCQLVTCPDLQVNDNVIYSSNSKSVGDFITVSCTDGFKLVGARKILCTSAGTWSHPFPRCEASGCRPPPPIENGKTFGQSYSPGDAVSFRCNRGFFLSGSNSIRCMSDNTWDNSAPTCIAFGSYASHTRPVCVLPCLHGGKCVGPYRCECPYGFAGSRCERVLCTTRCIGGARCKARHPSCQT